MTIVCDIGQGDVTVTDHSLSCNGTNISDSISTFIVTGNSGSKSVQIQNADVVVVISGVAITGDSPFVISGSSVTLIIAENNDLTSTVTAHAGMECSSRSNITLQALDGGTLQAVSHKEGIGIGPANGYCRSVSILNGSIDVSGGTGIGSTRASDFDSKLDNLLIANAIVEATSLENGAAIGTANAYQWDSTIGTLTIVNATIRATSSSSETTYGAAIGTSNSEHGNSTIDTITIWNSNITASSSSSAWNRATAIGTGHAVNGSSTIGTLTISNSNVVASSSSEVGGNYGSGIGTSVGSSGNSTIGTVMIWNSNVVASSSSVLGGNYGSGIGTSVGSSGNSTIGTVMIWNSNVVSSTSSNSSTTAGSGIGAGYGYGGNSTIGTLMISKTNVTARSSSLSGIHYGSGIGTSYAYTAGLSAIGNLTISHSTLTCSSSSSQINSGSGIGTGRTNGATSSIDTLTISNSIVTANSSSLSGQNYGSGIGTGRGSNGNSRIDTLTISNSTVRANSSSTVSPYSGSGIGAGYAITGNSTIGILTLSNANITASSSFGPAIGHIGTIGTNRSEVSSLILSGNLNLILRPGFQHRPIEAVSAELFNASVIVLIEEPPLFNVTSIIKSSFSLVILSENAVSSSDSELLELGDRWLEIGNLSYPERSDWTFCLTNAESRQCFGVSFPDASQVKSLAISVASDGNYSLIAFSEQMYGQFVTSNKERLFAVSSFESFIPAAEFIATATQSRSPLPSLSPTSSFTRFSQYTQRGALILAIWPFLVTLRV
jgi:hypothetical protein